MSASTAALILAWICVVLLALATAGLLRRVDALERRLADGGLPDGRLPDGDLGTAAGAAGPRAGLQLPVARYLGPAVQGRAEGGPRDILLLVVSPSCASCRTALDALAAASPEHLDLVVATAEDSLAPLPVPPGAVPLTGATELVDVLGVPATPFLVRIDADGTIRRADVVTSSTNLAAWTAPRSPLPVLHA